MFSKTVLALALSSVAAFAPVPSMTAPKTVVKAFESEVGAQAPLGMFDPLGIMDDGDEERFELFRYIETKHGRVAMLAVLGQIVTKSGIRLPGYIDRAHTVAFKDIPTGFKALSVVPTNGLLQFFLFIFFLEVGVMKDSANGAAPGEFPGDFRNGYIDFGWDKYSDDTKKYKRSIELNNGRAAMMGILGLMTHEALGVSIWPGGI